MAGPNRIERRSHIMRSTLQLDEADLPTSFREFSTTMVRLRPCPGQVDGDVVLNSRKGHSCYDPRNGVSNTPPARPSRHHIDGGEACRMINNKSILVLEKVKPVVAGVAFWFSSLRIPRFGDGGIARGI
jgi:hypothetical protein